MDTCSEGDGGRDLDLGDAETEDVLSSPPPGPVTMASVPMMVDQPQSPLSPGPVTMLANTTLDLSSFLDTLQTLADNASNSKGIQKCVLRISYDYFLLLYVRNHSERKF